MVIQGTSLKEVQPSCSCTSETQAFLSCHCRGRELRIPPEAFHAAARSNIFPHTFHWISHITPPNCKTANRISRALQALPHPAPCPPPPLPPPTLIKERFFFFFSPNSSSEILSPGEEERVTHSGRWMLGSQRASFTG